jgi:hypothetical protein
MCSIDNSAAQSKKTLLSYLTQREIPALRGRWTRRLRRFPFAGGLNARLRYDKRGATPPPAAVPPAPPPPLRGSPPAKGGAPCSAGSLSLCSSSVPMGTLAHPFFRSWHSQKSGARCSTLGLWPRPLRGADQGAPPSARGVAGALPPTFLPGAGAPCCPRSRSATEGGSPRPYAGAPGAAGWTPWPRLCRPPGPACSGVGCAPHTRALPGCGAPAAGSLTGMAHSGVESLRAIHGESKWGLRIVLI